MGTLAVLDELPAGYFVQETPRGVLAVHASAARALHESGYGPDQDGELTPSELSGRQPLYQFGESAAPSAAGYLVRRFSHGGLMRWLTGHRFLSPARPFRELILADSLLRAGIKTPRVVAARALKTFGGWRLDLMTTRIEDSVDLGWVLGAARQGELSIPVRRAILVALGSLVRKLHLHGCAHADLQPGNLLINRSALDGGDVSLWVLDLDRSEQVDKLTRAERHANLARLYRHVARRDEQFGSCFSRADGVRFFRGYNPDGDIWRADWRGVHNAHSAGIALHRIGWMLERALGVKRHDPRNGAEVQVDASAGS